MEVWSQIPEFPDYSISSHGRVRNDKYRRIVRTSVNTFGRLKVGMNYDRKQHTRLVAPLVARAFVPRPYQEHFIGIIHLNGDLTDCRADNLRWRPKWFSSKYHRQFRDRPDGLHGPIMDVRTGRVFESSWDAVVEFGLLNREIFIAWQNRTYVFPTGQRFNPLEDQVSRRIKIVDYNRRDEM